MAGEDLRAATSGQGDLIRYADLLGDAAGTSEAICAGPLVQKTCPVWTKLTSVDETFVRVTASYCALLLAKASPLR
jgi:hypothetical protein